MSQTELELKVDEIPKIKIKLYSQKEEIKRITYSAYSVREPTVLEIDYPISKIEYLQKIKEDYQKIFGDKFELIVKEKININKLRRRKCA